MYRPAYKQPTLFFDLPSADISQTKVNSHIVFIPAIVKLISSHHPANTSTLSAQTISFDQPTQNVNTETQLGVHIMVMDLFAAVVERWWKYDRN